MMPAIRPPSTVVRLLDGTFSSEGRIVETELMMLSFFCFEKATTVTSSSSVADFSMRATCSLAFVSYSAMALS